MNERKYYGSKNLIIRLIFKQKKIRKGNSYCTCTWKAIISPLHLTLVHSGGRCRCRYTHKFIHRGGTLRVFSIYYFTNGILLYFFFILLCSKVDGPSEIDKSRNRRKREQKKKCEKKEENQQRFIFSAVTYAPAVFGVILGRRLP